MESNNFKLTITPAEFFQEKIKDALSRQSVKYDENIEYYLVKLMCHFIKPVFVEVEGKSKNVFDVPLALLLKESLESDAHRKAQLLKTIADTSLYVSGFFQDYFDKKPYDIKYYIDIGSQSFLNLAILSRKKNKGSHVSFIYASLAKNFSSFLDVIAEVSEQTALVSDQSVLKLYDRWVKSQSNRLREKLLKKGLVLTDKPKLDS